MTIKQQGGVFGRNPTFNTVTADSDIQSERIGLGTSPSYPVHVKGTTNQSLLLESSDTVTGLAMADTSGSIQLLQNGGELRVYTNGAASSFGSGGTETFRFLANGSTQCKVGNFVVVNGNVAFSTSGKGIDFSATSGTGTSELFDDYEEGTFNCAYSTTGTAFDSITMDATRTKGYYVKIGRAVHVQCTLRTDAVTVGSASGDLIITGLPFSAIANSSGTGDGYASFAVSLTGGFASDHPFVLATRPGNAQLLVRKRTSVTAGDVAMVPSDMATGANANSITFSGTYYT